MQVASTVEAGFTARSSQLELGGNCHGLLRRRRQVRRRRAARPQGLDRHVAAAPALARRRRQPAQQTSLRRLGDDDLGFDDDDDDDETLARRRVQIGAAAPAPRPARRLQTGVSARRWRPRSTTTPPKRKASPAAPGRRAGARGDARRAAARAARAALRRRSAALLQVRHRARAATRNSPARADGADASTLPQPADGCRPQRRDGVRAAGKPLVVGKGSASMPALERSGGGRSGAEGCAGPLCDISSGGPDGRAGAPADARPSRSGDECAALTFGAAAADYMLKSASRCNDSPARTHARSLRRAARAPSIARSVTLIFASALR